MTDARTIIIEALGPEVPASWRKQVADRMFTALRSAGFEVCAVAAPTITPNDLTDDDYRNIEWCLREWATVEAQVAELARNGYELHRVAAPTITPQPQGLAAVTDPNYIDDEKSERFLEAMNERGGGPITPETDREIEFYEQGYHYGKFGELPGGGSITPADQEATDA